jgi:hypothetical protein
MTDSQFTIMIEILRKIADRQFTISGAADWPLLVALATIICAIIVGGGSLFWRDVKSNIREVKDALEKMSRCDKAARDELWEEIKACQDECCPRGRKV